MPQCKDPSQFADQSRACNEQRRRIGGHAGPRSGSRSRRKGQRQGFRGSQWRSASDRRAPVRSGSTSCLLAPG
jgi:hypothetical protein